MRVDTDKYQLHLRTLLNKDATRQAIIDALRQHLCQAGSKDVVLFYFCGHGAREKAGEEFKDWELDNAHETIVCCDSRSKTNGKKVPDLADKELRYLISQVANKGENSPDHVLVAFDCCHSSSGTRDLDDKDGVRQIDDLASAREYSDFCFADQIPKDKLSSETFPQGDHTFIAACLNTETAKETSQENSQKRGLFTYSLIKELESQNATLSYENLIQEVRTRVTGVRLYQNPQLEFVKGIDSANPNRTRSENLEIEPLAFLGDPAIIKPRDPSFTLKYRPHIGATRTDPEQQEEWIINAGAFQAIQEDMELAVYPEGSKYEDFEISAEEENASEPKPIKAGSVKAIAHIKIKTVRANESVVELVSGTETLSSDSGKSDSSKQFPAIVIKRPVPKVLFYFEGENQADQELSDKVKAKLDEWGSIVVGKTDDPKEAQYRLYVRNQQFEIRDGIDNRLLIERFPAEDDDKSITLAANRVEHIARWITTRDLENPNSSIDKDKIKLEVTYPGATSTKLPLVLYQASEKPKIQLTIKNELDYPLYLTILDLSGDYSIDIPAILYDGQNQEKWLKLEGGQTYKAKIKKRDSLVEDIPIGIPKGERYQKLTKYKETYKLIASTNPFDVDQFKLDALPIESDSGDRNTGYEDNEPPVGDWVTKQYNFTFIRSKPSENIQPNTKTPLSNGISIRLPDGFSANATLQTSATVSSESSDRNLGSIAIPLLKDAEPFDLIDRRGSERSISQISEQQLSGLKLSGDNLPVDKVTPESPIVILTDHVLEPNEGIVAFAHDGNFWLPVGYGMKNNDDKTEIKVERLVTDNNTEEGERDVSEAFSMCFQKVALGKQQTAWLRNATPNLNSTVSFTAKGDLESVKNAVAKAQNIVLFIHGIFGDTESMIPSLLNANLLNSKGTTEAGKYDLVLAFDYENLNTKIEETANILKQQLEKVGLKEGHKKTLHIVAHSMGGLVSRTFIELQSG
ncbi:MAG: caspase family protein, partial [Nostoc sp.]|uniref:caspase family protein n=1 Tax=Nostoc sp. TaxID=1180 RepID=UPI002FF900EE